MSALVALLDIPESTRPVLDPAIYVEPKDRDTAPEHDRQAAWVALMRRAARACLVVAIPNAAKRSRWTAGRLKREGMHTGFPDTAVYWADAGAVIEWKNGKGNPDDSQIETLNWLHARGWPVAICRTPEGAMRWLRQIGAPVPEVRV